MISIDDHPSPDPSSSHHHHQQETSHDLKVSDIDLKLPDADLDDTNNPTPNFSIRDYVLGLRSKDVACNWPFSHKSLQLCLKHGVKNLLPPFQSLDLLRDNSCFSKRGFGNRLRDEEFISSFDGKPTSNEERVLGSVSRNSSGFKRDNGSQFNFQEHLVHKRSKEKPPTSSQKTENIKKSRLVMKSNSGVEPIGEVSPSSFIVSETMASKVCPVCKTFTSSSNTTLNAHIDQCLTGEGTMKWTDTPKVIVKHRIKPRKTRLMLDIYETAPHCTIEELDRRNGTSWASNSSFPAQEFEFHVEEDKEDPIMNNFNPATADNEGDVYIDTNGTKVRILSVPKSGSSNYHKVRKSLKRVKGSKIFMGKKRSNIFKQKYLKLCSSKPQARNGEGEDVIVENGSKEVHTKVADLAIVRPPWACSKRTVHAKKFSGKNRKMKLQSCPTKDSLFESDKSSSQGDLGTPRGLSQNRKKMRSSEFRTESTSTNDDCEGFPDSSPQHNSDGADFRSNGGKFSYLRKNLSFPEAKFNLKKKFSSSKNSRVFRLSDDESSQDSLKEQSRIEEHTAASRKEETRSITSKSSNEESVRNETLSNLDQQVCVVPGSFIGFSNSFDPDGKNIFGNELEDDVEKHENYFQEIDPIPIPGPPGSFLPSPGGETVSQEQIHINSTENHHHHDQIDRDSMSTSPVSNVSHPSLARSDSRSSEKLSYRSNGDTSFKNDQPCCCSRKDTNGGSKVLNQGLLKNEMFSLNNYQNSPASEKKMPVYNDCESAASPSKPVLRLMGKNLTIVKTDEDESSSQQHPQLPGILSHYQIGSESRTFGAYPHVNMRNHVSLRPSHGGFVPHGGPYVGPTLPHGHNSASSSKPMKEIIIIDDSPENEGDDSMRNEFVGRNRAQMNPLYTMYQQPYSGGGGSPVFRGGGFQTLFGNGDLGRWNGGSSSPSRPMSHLRSSTTYFPPGYP